MQRGLKTVDGDVGPLVLNALVSGRATSLGTHTHRDESKLAGLTPVGVRQVAGTG